MVMDDASTRPANGRPFRTWLLAASVVAAAGCTTYVGTTAKSFLGHVRTNPDPNVRYLAYSKLASADAYETREQKEEAVRTLIDKYEKGHEPVASRAIICRTLGELRDPQARDLLVKAVSSPDAVIKIEACRALGKVGRSEDATVLAGVMTLDNLEDARIAAIEGLAELKTSDARIYAHARRRDGARGSRHPPGVAQCPPQADGHRPGDRGRRLAHLPQADDGRGGLEGGGSKAAQGRGGSSQGRRRDGCSAGRPVRSTGLDHAALTPRARGSPDRPHGRLARVRLST